MASDEFVMFLEWANKETYVGHRGLASSSTFWIIHVDPVVSSVSSDTSSILCFAIDSNSSQNPASSKRNKSEIE